MSTSYNHVQLSVVDEKKNVKVLYPQNTSSDVLVDISKNDSIPSGVDNVQDIIDNIGDMAFSDGNNMVYLSEDSEDYDHKVLETNEINDDTISCVRTWSSKKINTHIERFVPTYENTLSMISYLYLTAMKMIINGKDSAYVPYCPTNGYIWIVEYTPFVSSSTIVAGSPGVLNTPQYAHQRWTGHAFDNADEAAVVYERIYMDDAWGNFHKVN